MCVCVYGGATGCTWHLVKYICISAIIVQTVHVICKAANPLDKAKEKPHPSTVRETAHTTKQTHTQIHKRSTVCLCCLPAQFVFNLICILTTFCVWLKQARGGERKGPKKYRTAGNKRRDCNMRQVRETPK